MGLAFFKLSAAEILADGSDEEPTFLEVAAFKLPNPRTTGDEIADY
jgi:hypothetical protein